MTDVAPSSNGPKNSNRGAMARFRELLERAPGRVFYLKDLVTDLNATETAIQATANRAVREGGGSYKVHIPSRAWVYAPAGAVVIGRRMFEELATAKDGAVIIQDETGTIYRAVEL